MRTYAIDKQQKLGIDNVEFIDGTGEDLSQFSESEFDCAVSVHSLPILWEDAERVKQDCQSIVNGCLRVTKTGGYIAFVVGARDWKWDHLAGGMDACPDGSNKWSTDLILESLGFTDTYIRVINDYRTIEEALATYGFIYGAKAIDYIVDNEITKISWISRIYCRQV